MPQQDFIPPSPAPAEPMPVPKKGEAIPPMPEEVARKRFPEQFKQQDERDRVTTELQGMTKEFKIDPKKGYEQFYGEGKFRERFDTAASDLLFIQLRELAKVNPGLNEALTGLSRVSKGGSGKEITVNGEVCTKLKDGVNLLDSIQIENGQCYFVHPNSGRRIKLANDFIDGAKEYSVKNLATLHSELKKATGDIDQLFSEVANGAFVNKGYQAQQEIEKRCRDIIGNKNFQIENYKLFYSHDIAKNYYSMRSYVTVTEDTTSRRLMQDSNFSGEKLRERLKGAQSSENSLTRMSDMLINLNEYESLKITREINSQISNSVELINNPASSIVTGLDERKIQKDQKITFNAEIKEEAKTTSDEKYKKHDLKEYTITLHKLDNQGNPSQFTFKLQHYSPKENSGEKHSWVLTEIDGKPIENLELSKESKLHGDILASLKNNPDTKDNKELLELLTKFVETKTEQQTEYLKNIGQRLRESAADSQLINYTIGKTNDDKKETKIDLSFHTKIPSEHGLLFKKEEFEVVFHAPKDERDSWKASVKKKGTQEPATTVVFNNERLTTTGSWTGNKAIDQFLGEIASEHEAAITLPPPPAVVEPPPTPQPPPTTTNPPSPKQTPSDPATSTSQNPTPQASPTPQQAQPTEQTTQEIKLTKGQRAIQTLERYTLGQVPNSQLKVEKIPVVLDVKLQNDQVIKVQAPYYKINISEGKSIYVRPKPIIDTKNATVKDYSLQWSFGPFDEGKYHQFPKSNDFILGHIDKDTDLVKYFNLATRYSEGKTPAFALHPTVGNKDFKKVLQSIFGENIPAIGSPELIRLTESIDLLKQLDR